MLHFKPITIEDTDCEDADKLIGIMRKLGFIEQIKKITYMTVEHHKMTQPQLGLTMVPLITLDELNLSSCMVREQDVEEAKYTHEYAVPAYELLKRFSH